MIVLALALLILVLVFSVAIVLSNPDVYQLSLFRVLVPVTSAGVFFTGFGAALVTIAALLLLRTGIRRARENRRRLRTADRAAVTSAGPTEGSARRNRDADTDSDPERSGDPKTTSRGGEGGARTADDREPTGSTRHPDPEPSSLDLEPGEDPTTSPLDRRTPIEDNDRDEPRT